MPCRLSKKSKNNKLYGQNIDPNIWLRVTYYIDLHHNPWQKDIKKTILIVAFFWQEIP
jgi:hypothetical protein